MPVIIANTVISDKVYSCMDSQQKNRLNSRFFSDMDRQQQARYVFAIELSNDKNKVTRKGGKWFRGKFSGSTKLQLTNQLFQHMEAANKS